MSFCTIEEVVDYLSLDCNWFRLLRPQGTMHYYDCISQCLVMLTVKQPLVHE